jgi:uncharacterized caspase-like protein
MVIADLLRRNGPAALAAAFLLWMSPMAHADVQPAQGPTADPAPDDVRTYALFVGINSYKVLPVGGAVLDAEAVFERMTNAELGLVRPEDTIVLLEDEADGAAIDAALDELLGRADDNDVVIFFWAGRSEYDVHAEDLFLFPFDTRFQANGALESGEFSLRRRVLARAADFRGRFVFIGDSCGGFAEESLKFRNVTLLTSAQLDELALEGVFGHGLFTFHFLKALDEPRTDADRDGRVSLDEAYHSLYQRVVDDSRGDQHPGLVGADPQTIDLARAMPMPIAGFMPPQASADFALDKVRPRAEARVLAAHLPATVPELRDPDDLPADVGSEPRQALVIGNGNYASGIGRLANPSNDAEDMRRSLEKAGFDVTLGLDLDRDEMERAIVEFGRSLRAGGVGLFFYSGHAVQLNGKNYLIPIGAGAEDEDYVPLETIDLDHVIGRMGGADNRLNIIILDACRDNPFPGTFRSVNRGLAPAVAPRGTFVAYATAPNDAALDGLEGRNSPFTTALLDTLDDPGLKLEEVFKRVTAKVEEDTRGRQSPWVQSSVTGDFFFRPAARRAGMPEVADDPTDLAGRDDYVAWMAIQASREPIYFETFIEEYPGSPLRLFAERRLQSLRPD